MSLVFRDLPDVKRLSKPDCTYISLMVVSSVINFGGCKKWEFALFLSWNNQTAYVVYSVILSAVLLKVFTWGNIVNFKQFINK